MPPPLPGQGPVDQPIAPAQVRCRCRGPLLLVRTNAEARYVDDQGRPVRLTLLPERFPKPPCDRRATQEDGLCDRCRCSHGCCEDDRRIWEYLACRREGKNEREGAGTLGDRPRIPDRAGGGEDRG